MFTPEEHAARCTSGLFSTSDKACETGCAKEYSPARGRVSKLDEACWDTGSCPTDAGWPAPLWPRLRANLGAPMLVLCTEASPVGLTGLTDSLTPAARSRSSRSASPPRRRCSCTTSSDSTTASTSLHWSLPASPRLWSSVPRPQSSAPRPRSSAPRPHSLGVASHPSARLQSLGVAPHPSAP